MPGKWIRACSVDEVQMEDVITVANEGETYAVYRDADGRFFASDGLCTHEKVDLADGLVFGHTIECPKHNGRFDIRTGKAIRTPACVDLRTYAVKVEGNEVFVELPQPA